MSASPAPPAPPLTSDTPQTASPVRVVTAASLFDGHDAAINIMRRVLQSRGAEVIHLGHDRSVEEIVRAAVEEDAHAIAISSYQGGHNEFFAYAVERLRELGRPEIRVFGGGGGTITDREIADLHAKGVERIYSVEDGRELGLVGMIDDLLARSARCLTEGDVPGAPDSEVLDRPGIARLLTWIEHLHATNPHARAPEGAEVPPRLLALREALGRAASLRGTPVLGITGTGGAGKSSLTDELLRRMLAAWPDRRIAVLSVDPSRRRTGGALLGDRIRMNAASDERVFVRSLATRQSHAAVSAAVGDALAALRAGPFDLVVLETAGIGQSSTEVVDLVDIAMYVMTPEYGAPSQLEKIDMLDFADLIAINKSDKRGAEDALRYVRRQVQRNRQWFDRAPDSLPVYLCSASHFGDPGVDRLFAGLCERLNEREGVSFPTPPVAEVVAAHPELLPGARVRYLSEIADTIRRWHRRGADAVECTHRLDGLHRTLLELAPDPAGVPELGELFVVDASADPALTLVAQRYNERLGELDPSARELLASTRALLDRYENPSDEHAFTSLSGTRLPRVAVPSTRDAATRLRWRWFENVPGEFPFTAGVFPYKRKEEDPTRMFAGEGTPEKTNRRFHLVAAAQPAARLSTAFDSVTLYGRDPARRPDIWGKIGNSGVSVATLDDAKKLYSGFDLNAPTTSVSMTINGPAPMILAMFFNTAIDQAVEKRLRETGRWEGARQRIAERSDGTLPYDGPLPDGHSGLGLGMLGVTGDQLLDAEEYAEIRSTVLRRLRGTVQADILKEDQAQNTCIFSTEFALRMMGDIQQYFVDHAVRYFYSVSISGYHIAEAGANPITQLAFTLANGFTFVEYFRARGMDVDQFAHNLSFFFSNGIDPEYTVIGRVARRIWAVAMRELYGAGRRSQQLKYHIQTSGRSLHAQEIDFNDIRTTLQALYAIADHCNSLHTNAYDEAITTPTEPSVRRALAIQLILNREFGLLKNENPWQGSHFIEQLTDAVEAAVLAEFERLSERGGVLGAMELMYQRSRIQEESLEYEHRKHSGELPIIGVNTFIDPSRTGAVVETELVRSNDAEKLRQLAALEAFHQRHAGASAQALERLQAVAREGGNLFDELMDTVKVCSLGQITDALFEVGGQYRRNM